MGAGKGASPAAGAGQDQVGSVLVVDDQAELRQVVAHVLSGLGFSVTEAATTEEALEALDQSRYALVISDVLMPGGGAEAILDAMGTYLHPPPVVLMTGAMDLTLATRLIAKGAVGCLNKPFRLRDLVGAVRPYL